MYLISVIVPVFNTNPHFLKKCLLSLTKQSYRSLEILIIDSSTNEDTISFINDFSNIDPRIKVIRSLKNVSLQRNIGIDCSNGDLIAFVDSDDYLNNDYFKKMIETMIYNKADIVFPQLIKELYSNNIIINKSVLDTIPIYEDIDEKNFFVGTEKNRLVNPVKLYKRSLIGDTRFRSDLSHGEDMLFNYSLANKGFKAIFCPDAFYTFTAIDGSNAALKRFSKSSIKIVFVMFKMIKKYHDKNDDNYQGMYYQFCYLFNTYYYGFIKTNKFLWVIRFTKLRVYYFLKNRTFSNFIYMFFPFTRKIIKYILKRQ